jgi:uncharacterized protein YndB with AHSA1/START domain
MKLIMPTLLLALRTVALHGQDATHPTTTQTTSERVVRVDANIHAPVSEVWRVFTTSQGAEEFFAQKANIGLAIGGPYEIQFDPKDERSGTKGLKILSYAPEEMLSFQWNAPPEMPEVRNGGTWVVVEMHPLDAYQTHVTITHLGWKDGPEWDRAYVHFQRGWSELMSRLEKRFTDGPINWRSQTMMHQESKAHNQ